MSPRLRVVALCLGAFINSVLAATGGSFADGGHTVVSALLMFLGIEDGVYIVDKAEGNAARVKGHPAWGSRWDIATHEATVMDIKSNSFCSSGMHLPNGSFVTFGGNDGITVGGKVGNQQNPDGTGFWDSIYQDFDGRKAIRILNPCGSHENHLSAKCDWYDEPTTLAMKRNRWYAAAEPLGDGTVVILGGFVSGGYINRWKPDRPNVDAVTQAGLAENSYEYYPAKAKDAEVVNFLVKTSGLNSYAHTFLMPSGRMLVQANHSTMLWDHNLNQEFPLPDMPKGVIRVYPASGGVAMLPLTPENNYTPTLLFCGGSDMPDDNWGDYGGPNVDTWNFPASDDCQRLTPEPADQSAAAVAYEQDDDMPDPRTMGQLLNLPDGTLLMVNGGRNGTAGYADKTNDTPGPQMPFGPSLASGPVLTPAIYNPAAPRGSRWSSKGLAASTIPRMYHSSAILLPDASVLIAGSNPNADVNLDVLFPTEYRAEIFYPPYFSATVRPAPVGAPTALGYGGPAFDVTLPATSYTGAANAAADKTAVVLVRGGVTTHGMNMGQRHMQLRHTYTVHSDGAITLHVAQLPPNANLFQPGPALLFVVVDGVPSNATWVTVGSGKIELQPTAEASVLPPSVRLDSVTGSGGGTGAGAGGNANGNSTGGAGGKEEGAKSNLPVIIGCIVGGVLVVGVLGALIAVCMKRRNRSAARMPPSKEYGVGIGGAGAGAGAGLGGKPVVSGWATSHDGDSSVFVPLAKGGSGGGGGQYHDDNTWDARTGSMSINAPYKDEGRGTSSFGSRSQVFGNDAYDPYSGQPPVGHAGSAMGMGEYATSTTQLNQYQYQQQQQQQEGGYR
ncbi:hypothetical protein CVT25_007662 [Psilocybe cyanescens]|uniref:Galactose oxidase-like Early set domain-containing protein n=1 Tax=Psilocybe cyanescens TaxID=93625 RepID=A0A409VW71_PSICY|nr:hypothetical protein CVT25_007662 [Psilocybe cyanescens]